MGSFYGGGSDNITVHVVSETGSGSTDISTIIGTIPFYYEREYLPTSDKTSITILANTQVGINGKGYYTTKDTTLSTAGVAEPGKDVYIYACAPNSGTTPTFVLSQNSTVPDGYDADNSRKIGGFHCLCADVGEISEHPLSGYVAGDILPASIWDLKHRPVSDPEGMVYDEGTCRWYDIYLSSWDGSKLVSEYNGIIATGATAAPFHGLKFIEYLGQCGKRLVWRNEFMCVAKGSNENTSIAGATNPVTTGGHVDSSGRRMISNIGLEDCCGVVWQWANDEYEIFQNDGSIGHWIDRSDRSYRYLLGYDWFSDISSSNEPVATYAEDIDSQQYGDTYGMPRQAHVGGYWSSGHYAGSRCVLTDNFGSSASIGTGARGTSDRR